MQQERSSSRSRRASTKDKTIQKALPKVKTEVPPHPANEAEKEPDLAAAVELQMSPVTPKEGDALPDPPLEDPAGKSLFLWTRQLQHLI